MKLNKSLKLYLIRKAQKKLAKRRHLMTAEQINMEERKIELLNKIATGQVSHEEAISFLLGQLK